MQMKRIVAMLLVISMVFTSSFGCAQGTLTLPASLREIAEEAFSGAAAWDVVDIPHGTESIGPRAFAGSEVTKAYIPSSVYEIADDAFDGCAPVIVSPDFSHAQAYAKAHGLQWEDSGDHYPTSVADTIVGVIENGFVVENPQLEDVELLSTENVADPDRLAAIEEYNALALELQKYIDLCNDTSAYTEALDSLNDAFDGLALSEVEGGVSFTYGTNQYIIDDSLCERIRTGTEVTDASISEDGSSMTITAGGKTYGVYTQGTTMYIAAANSALEHPATFSAASVSMNAKDVADFFEWKIIAIKTAFTAISEWITMMIEHLENVITRNEQLIKWFETLGLDTKKAQERIAGASKKLKDFMRVSVYFEGLNIFIALNDMLGCIEKLRLIAEIDDHGHPTEFDVYPEGLEASKLLEKEIAKLTALIYVDMANNVLSIVCSVATGAASLSRVSPLPKNITACCERLGAKLHVSGWLSWATDLIITVFENNKYIAILDIDRSLHTIVSGVVYDAVTMEPLQYVSVYSDENSAVTDGEGWYEIYVSPGEHTLVFSRDEYVKQEITVDAESGKNTQYPVYMRAVGATPTPVPTATPTPTPTPTPTSTPTSTPCDFTYTIENGEVTITGYTGTDEAITIPAIIDGCPVTKIGENAFEDLLITSVVIPEGVVEIDDGAFFHCYMMETAHLPSTIKRIGVIAFSNCGALTAVNIPEGVTEIEDSAFFCCYSLKQITLPQGLTKIGNHAFGSAELVTDIVIPDGVTSIGEFAFSKCQSAKSITIPDSVSFIGKNAFDYCVNLTSFHIPEGITTIHESTFDLCKSLTSIIIPENVTVIERYAFINCDDLESVTILGDVNSIGENVFGYCEKLRNAYVSNQYLADYFAANYPDVQVTLLN